MLYKLTDTEIRNLCKGKLESLEHWLRRLIDETLSAKYGDYFSYVDGAGNRLIKNDVVQSLEERRRREPDRYKRKIDAVLLDDLVAIIYNRQIHPHFRSALEKAFPEGVSEARTFLKRLTDPRNNPAHANPISLRQAEQVLCYSNDIIDSLRAYYVAIGMEQEYDVPLILKVTDSLGNVFHRDELLNAPQIGLSKWLTGNPNFFLRPGDMLTAEVEVDSTFKPTEYEVVWRASSSRDPFQSIADGPKAVLVITALHVSQRFELSCTIKSKRD